MSPTLDANKIVTVALTTSDVGQAASYENILFKDVNIHVYGADVFYGTGTAVNLATQSSATPNCSIIRANAVVWFQEAYVNQLFFKSYVNATPGYVVITGTV